MLPPSIDNICCCFVAGLAGTRLAARPRSARMQAAPRASVRVQVRTAARQPLTKQVLALCNWIASSARTALP